MPGSGGGPRRRAIRDAHPTRAARRGPAARPAGRRLGRGLGRGLGIRGLALPGRFALRRPSFTATRAAAILALLATLGLGYGAVTSSAFELRATDVSGIRWTTREAVAAAAREADGRNVFRIQTAPIASRVRELPAVATAHVTVALPDRLVVEVTERTPVLAWRVGDERFLVDRTGRVFATADAAAVEEVSIPTVVDSRASATGTLAIGASLDPDDLDAATRLASLTPSDVGSVATALLVSVTDENGFVVTTSPRSWTAIFGFYTPSVRRTEIIPGQVRLLRSLLAGREAIVARVVLADADKGTWVPRPTPSATP